jgi:hypothetical protein
MMLLLLLAVMRCDAMCSRNLYVEGNVQRQARLTALGFEWNNTNQVITKTMYNTITTATATATAVTAAATCCCQCCC